MMSDRIVLSNDGTMDTVLLCTACRAEIRYYNYDGGMDIDTDDERSDEQRYDDFVAWAIEDAESYHECQEAK